MAMSVSNNNNNNNNNKNPISSTTTSSSSTTTTKPKIIDSHLHVWASKTESLSSYPYASSSLAPEKTLQNRASTNSLLNEMDKAGIDGALIVQPIHHKFDHTYVSDAIRSHPNKFKGMLLHNPELDPQQAIQTLEDLSSSNNNNNKGKGLFVGVRFNPYLWPGNEDGMAIMPMSQGSGSAVFAHCAKLRLPVGIMCFKGLSLHYDDIVELIRQSPETIVILDHFGFCGLDDRGDVAFEQLQSLLSEYTNVYVKISALFRLVSSSSDNNDDDPYEEVRTKRFLPLLDNFGPDRLMFGTDFPFVLEQEGGYGGTLDLLRKWTRTDLELDAILHGTAERVFGPWGKLG